MDLISIVVPVYNTENYLQRCVKSIIDQTYVNLEIILIDDGSIDNSSTICDHLSKLDKRIKVIHKENEGLGLTRNVGLKVASGDYVCFIDSDDYLAKEYIETNYLYLKKCCADVCYCGHTKDINGKYVIRKNPLAGEVYSEEEIKKVVIPRMCGCETGNDNVEMSSCMAIYSLGLIKQNSLIFPSEREFVSEDLVFNIMYLSHCERICANDNVGYFYVTVESSLTRKYDPNKLSKQIVMTQKVIELTKNLGVLNLCERRIYNNFMTWVRAIIKSEQNRYSEIGFKPSIAKIYEICNNDYVIHISNTFDNIGVRRASRIINLLIKMKKPTMLWMIMLVKNKYSM